MKSGSVIVNGVHFDTTATAIAVNDRAGQPASELKDGMVVQVRGRRYGDGVTGIAERVEAEHVVLGTVELVKVSALPQCFYVLQQKVIVDDTTVFAGVEGLEKLTPRQDRVEVYGQRDANGDIRATRVELVTTMVVVDELQGVVTDKDVLPATFRIGGLVIGYGSGTQIVGGTAFANGDRVEVTLNGTTATIIQLEDVEDAVYRPVSGEEVEIEGYVSAFAGHPGNFDVDGRPVRTTASTRFEGGTALNLANGVKVEVEGNTLDGARLIVDKLVFRRERVALGGTITAVDASTRTLVVVGKTIQLDDRTEISAAPVNSFQSLQVGDQVEVEGYLDRSGVVVAKQINETDVGTYAYLQAPVTLEDETGRRLVLAGIPADLGATTTFRDANGVRIDVTGFFAAVVPASATQAGTVVKVRGILTSPANLSVVTAEIQ
jgi:hypothetical protein